VCLWFSPNDVDSPRYVILDYWNAVLLSIDHWNWCGYIRNEVRSANNLIESPLDALAQIIIHHRPTHSPTTNAPLSFSSLPLIQKIKMPPRRSTRSRPRSPSENSTASVEASLLSKSRKTTPATSQDEEEESVSKPVESLKKRNKRVRMMSEDLDAEDSFPGTPVPEKELVRPTKKRMITKEVYIDVPSISSLRKGKGKAVVSAL